MAIEKIGKGLWINEGENGWFTQISENKDGSYTVDLFSEAGKEDTYVENNLKDAKSRATDWVNANQNDKSYKANQSSRGIGGSSTSGT